MSYNLNNNNNVNREKKDDISSFDKFHSDHFFALGPSDGGSVGEVGVYKNCVIGEEGGREDIITTDSNLPENSAWIDLVKGIFG